MKNMQILDKNNDWSALNMNDPIVHIEHGIGRYQGLTTIKTASIESDYLVILYADNDRLYVPMSNLHLISCYVHAEKEKAPLHKLGGEIWNKEKKKITKILYDHASKLLKIYATRATKKGFSFKKNTEQYHMFCKSCPFKTTQEQNSVIKHVLEDMYRSTPMDRLVCGDVGFGKTEIAMRAAFLSVSNKKQVAILVPTTLLAQQHLKNFKERFFNWSINIDMLSRFCNQKQEDVILKKIKNAKIDILIGTHKLLIKKILWGDLGLLIIDEEHRFGVYHKEMIKKKYSTIDILTLTATPIPRTLNMAMTGIKDISIINKPPAERLAIKTVIQEYNSTFVKSIILREIMRGGQIYYIYNKVRNIHKIALKLSNLVPEARIKIGHGKMHDTDLKKVIYEFSQNKFNLFVCTTIIESGIDIPKANTIIIENADHFGLSQLHQLRGRIGRSNSQGYAYLLVNNLKKITYNANKRLQAIESMNHLGSGFILSNKDLDIRGVGELLGNEQSGHIQDIGLSLYTKLLKDTVKLLKKGKKISVDQLSKKSLDIELSVSALFPKDYIIDVHKRLLFYKKLATAKEEQEIEKIKYELIYHFGPLPKFSKHLILCTKIRLISKNLGVNRLSSNNNIGIIKFNNNNAVNIEHLLKLFHKQPKTWKMEGSRELKFFYNCQDDYLRLKWIVKFLKDLQVHSIKK